MYMYTVYTVIEDEAHMYRLEDDPHLVLIGVLALESGHEFLTVF